MSTIIFCLITWGVIGVLNLISGNITRLGYFCCWAALMIALFYRYTGM